VAGSFVKGLAPVQIGEQAGYINRKGEITIDTKFSSSSAFSEGLAVVGLDGKFGYTNREGKLEIDNKFDEAGAFNDGVATVRIGRQIGYVDKKGEFIWQHELPEKKAVDLNQIVKLNNKLEKCLAVQVGGVTSSPQGAVMLLNSKRERSPEKCGCHSKKVEVAVNDSEKKLVEISPLRVNDKEGGTADSAVYLEARFALSNYKPPFDVEIRCAE
jgi:hypothetical protein